MKLKKMILTGLLCITMAVGLTACAGPNIGTTQTGSSDVESSQASNDTQDGAKESAEVQTGENEHIKSLLGNWVMVAMCNEGDYYMPDDMETNMELSVYEEDGKYYADYASYNYSDVEIYGMKLVEEKKPLREEGENKEWSVRLERKKNGNTTYAMTLTSENILELLITYTYDYEDYETGETIKDVYESCYFMVPENADNIEEIEYGYRYRETITVSNIKELYDAIGSSRHIILKAGVYNISDLPADQRNNPDINQAYDEDYEPYTYIDDQLEIQSIKNLILEGEEGAEVEICTNDSYCTPLILDYCNNVTLKNLTIGHHVEPGYCSGDVIGFEGGNNITIENCRLYGSGAYGIWGSYASNVNIVDTDIFECTYGLVRLYSCYTWNFQNCKLRDSSEFTMLEMVDCGYISYNDCSITGNSVNKTYDYSYLIDATDSYNIAFNRCTIKDNVYPEFMTGEVDFVGCDVQMN